MWSRRAAAILLPTAGSFCSTFLTRYSTKYDLFETFILARTKKLQMILVVCLRVSHELKCATSVTALAFPATPRNSDAIQPGQVTEDFTVSCGGLLA